MADYLLLASFAFWAIIGWYCYHKPTGPTKNDYLVLLGFFLLHILALFINSTGIMVIP